MSSTSQAAPETATEIARVFELQREHQWDVKASTAAERKAKLARLKSAVEAHADRIVAAVREDTRKPEGEIRVTEVLNVLGNIQLNIDSVEEWMKPTEVTPSKNPNDRAMIVPEARGVCLILGPWNFPLGLTFGPLAFAVFAYVVMDGFDLGIGILFPTLTVGHGRNRAMNSIAPVWDGNETWLVLGGGGLMAAFPLAYAVILPATYPLIIAMLLGLVFRGVAFEFRWRDERHRPLWDFAFFAGSFVAALSQGMVLGALLQGIEVTERGYSGSWFDWLTPYTLLTGLGVVAGYALLGACWLVWKTEGELQDRVRRLATGAAIATLVLMAAVSLYNLFLFEQYRERWLAMPNILFASQVPLLTAIIAYFLFRGLAKRWEIAPFLLSLALFLLGMAGLGVSMWPYVVPDTVTIWDAAAPERSQAFMLVGLALTLPLILGYTGWAYWVFRGKVGAEGYH